MSDNSQFLTDTLRQLVLVTMSLANSLHAAGKLLPDDAEAIADEFAALAATLNAGTDDLPGTFPLVLHILARKLRDPNQPEGDQSS